MGPVGCPETSVAKYQPTSVTPQKSEGLNYTAVEAWNLCSNFFFYQILFCIVQSGLEPRLTLTRQTSAKSCVDGSFAQY
jgi:hypothetical protein